VNKVFRVLKGHKVLKVFRVFKALKDRKELKVYRAFKAAMVTLVVQHLIIRLILLSLTPILALAD